MKHSPVKKNKSATHRFKPHKKSRFKAETKPERKHEPPTHVVGVLKETQQGWRLESTDRRNRGDYSVRAAPHFTLIDGVLARAEIRNPGQRFGAREAKVIEILGSMDAPNAVSLIAIATHQMPTIFDEQAIADANGAKPVTLEGRTDLRAVPLITIDGIDARDFDDAVFAEKDGDGWHVIVAIADVAHYVRTGSVLDKNAYDRGNSVYFPDRVVPMLPEALSNELCSLKPNVDRASLAVHLWIDKAGELTRWQFVRAVIRSHARLTYEQAQAAMDGRADAMTEPLLETVIKPLYGAYNCLMRARLVRGTLDLDLPERKIEIENGKIKSVKVRERLDSHKLVEEMMIAANVAAAAQLEHKSGACIYRIHDKPSEMKLQALRDFLASLDISLAPAKDLHPRMLTKILSDAQGGPYHDVVNEVMLRSQSQAVYSPNNVGHFGLALAKYAHFTSPIRRYADLVVHRGLIRACGLGDDGISDHDMERLEKIAEHISGTERRAAQAEREANDRYVTLYMEDKEGVIFPARISGITRNCLFAKLNETGADGLIPINSLPSDYYHYDEKRQALIGKRHGRCYQLSRPVMIKIIKADSVTGSMSFQIIDDEKPNQKTNKSNINNNLKTKKPHRKGLKPPRFTS